MFLLCLLLYSKLLSLTSKRVVILAAPGPCFKPTQTSYSYTFQFFISTLLIMFHWACYCSDLQKWCCIKKKKKVSCLPNACHTVEGQEIGQSLHETITIEMGNSNLFLCRKPLKSFSLPVHCILLMMLASVSFCPCVFFPCSFSQCVRCKYKDKQRKWSTGLRLRLLNKTFIFIMAQATLEISEIPL